MAINQTSSNLCILNPLALGNKDKKTFNDNSLKSNDLCLKILKNNFALIEMLNSIKDIKREIPGHKEIYFFLSDQYLKIKHFIVFNIPKDFLGILAQNILLYTKFGEDQFEENGINLIFCRIPNLPKKLETFEEPEFENIINSQQLSEFANTNDEKDNFYPENDEDYYGDNCLWEEEPTMINEEKEDNKNIDKEEKISNEKVKSFFKINQDVETMIRTEVEEEEKKLDEKVIINNFLSNIKISLNKENDSLSFDIESLMKSGNLNVILKHFSNDRHLNEWISPFMFEENWYIPLPNWVL